MDKNPGMKIGTDDGHFGFTHSVCAYPDLQEKILCLIRSFQEIIVPYPVGNVDSSLKMGTNSWS